MKLLALAIDCKWLMEYRLLQLNLDKDSGLYACTGILGIYNNNNCTLEIDSNK
jgi:hypothetical protein